MINHKYFFIYLFNVATINITNDTLVSCHCFTFLVFKPLELVSSSTECNFNLVIVTSDIPYFVPDSCKINVKCL